MFSYSQTPYTRFARNPGRISGSQATYGLTYPSPFFDVAHTYLPDTLRRLFQWCRYYYLTNPIIAAVINKMAEYAVTDIIIHEEDDGLRERWESFLEEGIDFRSFCIDYGLYYNAYGNAVTSIHFPFNKYLKCDNCGAQHNIKDVTYKFIQYEFRLNPCPECQVAAKAEARDIQIKAPNKIKPILWNPEDVIVAHNDVTGEDTHYFEVPKSVRNDIMLGKPHVIETMPQLVIDAVRRNRLIQLNSETLFHGRRPSILNGSKDAGMGVPMILPVLKDSFYGQILKKANEAIALEHIFPLSVVYPAAGSGSSDPYSTISLTKWRDKVQDEINRWRQDRAYIPIMPLPLGHQVIGGQGRAMMVNQELRMLSEHIIAGMGVPQEFVFGGLQWSGSNVSLRMLENSLLRYISGLSQLMRFMIRNVAAYLNWPVVDARFKPFKMADDMQRKALLVQLNSASKLSDETLLADLELKAAKEDELIRKETGRRMDAIKKQQLAQAEMQGEAQIVMARYQARAQSVAMQEQQQAQQGMMDSAPGEALEGVGPNGQMSPNGPSGPSGPPVQPPQGPPPDPQMVQQIAQQISAMPPPHQQMVLQQIAQQSPQLAEAVAQALSAGGNGTPQLSAGAPLPEQRPPRRGVESGQI